MTQTDAYPHGLIWRGPTSWVYRLTAGGPANRLCPGDWTQEDAAALFRSIQQQVSSEGTYERA